MKDPRIEAAAKALYGDVNRQHSTTKGWDEVRPRWQESYRSNARAVIEAIDNASTITTVEELDKLPVGTVAMGWAYDGSTPYLRCISARGRTVWGVVGQPEVLESADLLKGGFKARVIHWGHNA